MKTTFLAIAAIAAATVASNAQNVQITEVMYTGLFGEFVELTNLSGPDADFAAASTNGSDNGWKFSDNRAGTNVTGTGTIDATSLSQIGLLAAGKSAIITEVSDTIFIQAWYTEPSKTAVALVSTKIVENNAINLGRADTVNIYDEDNFLIQSLPYNDAAPISGPRSEDVSAKPPVPYSGNFTNWTLSAIVGGSAAWKAGVPAAPGPIGSPGVYPN